MSTVAKAESRVYSLITSELRSIGIDTVFGLVGEDTVALTADLAGAGVHYVGARHESAAVAMADGYSWATGGLGVCLVTRGPGMTNALTACRTAVQRGQQLLLVTGDVPAVAGDGAFYKDIDQEPVCRSVGLEYFRASAPEAVLPALREATASALAGRPAVVAVDADVLNGVLGDAHGGGAASVDAEPPRLAVASDAEVDQIVELVARSERPVILVGQGACDAQARDALLRLAERTGALIGTTLLAKGLFAGVPYEVGVIGGFASDPVVPLLREADLLLAFGASLNPFTTAEHALFQEIPVVQVATERRPFIGCPVRLRVEADATDTARRLLAAIDEPAERFRRPEVLERLAAPLYSGDDESTADRLDPRIVATTLDELLPRDRAVVLDSGRFMSSPGRYVRVPGPLMLRHTAEGGSIGLGLGVALGAAVGRPQRTTVLFTGDGGLSMALADLETATRHAIPLVIVVMNDGAYGSELNVLAASGLPGEQAELPDVDFAAVAAAVGYEATTVRTVEQLRATAPRLLEPTAPLLIDCKIRPDLAVPRRV